MSDCRITSANTYVRKRVDMGSGRRGSELLRCRIHFGLVQKKFAVVL